MQQHLAARMGAAGFDKAQMPGRDAGVAGEIELAQAPALPPLAQQSTDGLPAIEHGAKPSPAAGAVQITSQVMGAIMFEQRRAGVM